MKKAVVLFYCSPDFGSEYRFGWEYLSFAIEKLNFNTVIISDISKNITPEMILKTYPNLTCIVIPSIVKKDDLLRKFTDFAPQTIWHLKAMYHLLLRGLNFDTIWVTTGAQPWLPIRHYMANTKNFIWGPVGGGEPVKQSLDVPSSIYFRTRERARNAIMNFSTKLKKRAFLKSVTRAQKRISILTRTTHSYKIYEHLSPQVCVKLFPEILSIAQEEIIEKNSEQDWLPYLWVGQNIARKNLPLGINIFREISSRIEAPQKLEVFGVNEYKTGENQQDITYHGWVKSVPWRKYRGKGVFILSSSREGVPSALLEAFQAGYFCIVPDVGAIQSVFSDHARVFIYNPQDISDSNLIYDQVAHAIEEYLTLDSVHVPHISYEKDLYKFLNNA